MKTIVTGPLGSGKSTIVKGLAAFHVRNSNPVESFDFRDVVRSSSIAGKFLSAMRGPASVILEVEDGRKDEFAVWLHERGVVTYGSCFGAALTLFDQHVQVGHLMSFKAVKVMRYWEGIDDA